MQESSQDSKIDFNAVIKALPVQLKRLQSAKCPQHPSQTVSALCLSRKCKKSILCLKCLIEDTEHHQSCSAKGQVQCIEDFYDTVMEVLRQG